MNKNGKKYEILIEHLYKKLDADSNIKRNDKIYGHNSKTLREIDISIKHKIGPHEVLMIVQAKDHNKPVDVNLVGAFHNVIQDVRANKGIIISAKGFTKSALILAKSHDIDALTAHDLENPKWAIDLKMPVILNAYSGNYNVSFTMSASQEYADAINSGRTLKCPPRHLMKISEDGGRTFFTIQEKFYQLCSDEHLKYYDGEEHKAVFEGKELLLFVTDGILNHLYDFTFVYRVVRKRYFKYFEVKEFQGLIDKHKNTISRSNVKVESDDFIVQDYEVIQKRDIDLSTWDYYDESIKLIHPYKIHVSSLNLPPPSDPIKWEFAGNRIRTDEA